MSAGAQSSTRYVTCLRQRRPAPGARRVDRGRLACRSRNRHARHVGHVPRDVAPGLHHVVVGATGDEDYFRTDTDRLVWIRRLTRTLERFAWTCVTLCQLTTHVHAIFDVPDESLPVGMHFLNAFYGKYFNETYERRGTLVRSRYWSKRIEDDEQLLAT